MAKDNAPIGLFNARVKQHRHKPSATLQFDWWGVGNLRSGPDGVTLPTKVARKTHPVIKSVSKANKENQKAAQRQWRKNQGKQAKLGRHSKAVPKNPVFSGQASKRALQPTDAGCRKAAAGNRRVLSPHFKGSRTGNPQAIIGHNQVGSAPGNRQAHSTLLSRAQQGRETQRQPPAARTHSLGRNLKSSEYFA